MTNHAALPSDHTPTAVHRRIGAENRPGYVRDFVYGAIDGCVTTFAIVAGVVGAERSPSLIVILGLANLLADGLSMAVGNFLGTKSELEMLDRARRIEEDHIEHVPEGEREEIREIFRLKGFEGDLLEQVVDVITADRRQWVDTMLVDEWGLSLTRVSPLRAATVTLIAFVTIGFVPLLAYVLLPTGSWEPATLFRVSVVTTGATFFGVGALKSLVTETRWWRGGLETLLMGGAAAAVAYGVGAVLRDFG